MATGENSLERRIKELEKALKESREEIDYYRNIARESGKRHLREADQVANLLSELKIAEESLRRSEERFKSLSENAPDIIFTLDTKGTFTYLNSVFREIMGYDEPEAVGRPFISFLKKVETTDFLNHFQNALNKKKTIRDINITLLHRDGTERLFVLSITPDIDSRRNVTGIIGLCKDMTQWHRLEEQLYQSKRMEAIATLAGGIAHEFNNALVGIAASIDLLAFDMPDNDNIRKHGETMRSSVKNMTYLTEQLLAYAKGGQYQPEKLFLDDFIRETIPIIRHNMSPGIALDPRLTAKGTCIIADRTQMQMVFSSLLINASEAIDNLGVIRLKTENEEMDETENGDYPNLKAGTYVSLTIEDKGKGMDEKTRSRIFEPFFTTKSHGRGLGLAAAFGIVKNHGGWISVQSEPGKGTLVKVLLPAVAGEEPEGRKGITG